MPAARTTPSRNTSSIEEGLWEHGWATIPRFAEPQTCVEIAALYDDPSLFRSHIRMERYNFGRGEYAYFANPLPPRIQTYRESLYAQLAPIANDMNVAMGRESVYPATLAEFEACCAERGQTKPTPLILKYGKDDYNCLHRDLYGDIVFPVQAMLMLSRRGRDYDGGEFVLVENRPRQQSRAEVLTPAQGDLVIFAVNERPARTPRGVRRVTLRHGVGTITRGARLTLGIIFHNAR